MNISYTILIPLIPLAVFLLLGLNSKRIKPAISGYIGVLGLSISAALSFYTAYQYFFVKRKSRWCLPNLCKQNRLDELYRNLAY